MCKMKMSFMGKFGLAAVCGLAASALADNPISSYHYLADPGAAADDTYFYVITDSDDPAALTTRRQPMPTATTSRPSTVSAPRT